MDTDKRTAGRTCWTVSEDAALRAAVVHLGAQKWAAVAREPGLDARPPKSCRLRWLNHLAPAVRKERFHQSESRAVALGYVRYGHKWSHIAREIPGRTDSAVKNHWNNYLRPRYVRTLSDILEAPMVSDIRAAATFGVGPEMIKKAIFSHASKTAELNMERHGNTGPQTDGNDKKHENQGNESDENNEHLDDTEISESRDALSDGPAAFGHNGTLERSLLLENNGTVTDRLGVFDWIDSNMEDPNPRLFENDEFLANITQTTPQRDKTGGSTLEHFPSGREKNDDFASETDENISYLWESRTKSAQKPLRSWGNSGIFDIKNRSMAVADSLGFRFPPAVETLITEEDETQCLGSSCPNLVTVGSVSSSNTDSCPQLSMDGSQNQPLNAFGFDDGFVNNVDTASLNTLESLFIMPSANHFDSLRNVGAEHRATKIGEDFPMLSSFSSENKPLNSADNNRNVNNNVNSVKYGSSNWSGAWGVRNSIPSANNNSNNNSNSNNNNNSNSNSNNNSTSNNNSNSNSNSTSNINNTNENQKVREERNNIFDTQTKTSLLNSSFLRYESANTSNLLQFDHIHEDLPKLPFLNLPKTPIPERFGTDMDIINSVVSGNNDWMQLTDSVNRNFKTSQNSRQVPRSHSN